MTLLGFASKTSRKARELGQISVLAALMIGTTFFLFLAFVTNTGMVVHAKINLQNAADVAAYAGAATQARQMNHIAILNYEMRRQFKKFLLRYYVLGSSAGINQALTAGPVPWGPNASHGVPAVCLVYRRDDNFCQLTNLPEIAIPNPGFLDSIGQALKGVLQGIENLRRANCEEIGLTNIMALYLWLFNTEASGSTLLQNLAQSTSDLTIPSTLQAVTQGLGLVPKNLLLKKRIDSLQRFVNYPPAKDMTLEKIEAFEEGGDFFARERTLQAFYSAYRTLGPKLFDDSTIFLDELLPEGGQMLELEPVFAEFDTFAVQPEFDSAARGCVQKYFHIPITGRTLPVGVHKRSASANVHYAVRLRAKARVLFSPFGELEMTAYAAAKPFGSRIGPRQDANAWVRPGGPGQTFLNHSSQPSPQLVGKIPNLGMLDPNTETGAARGQGFDKGDHYSALLNTSREATSGGPPTLTQRSVDRAIRTAMAPLRSEHGRYVIPVDIRSGNTGSPDLATESVSYYSQVGNGIGQTPSPWTAFYAPVKDRETASLDPLQEIEDILQGVQVPTQLTPAKQTIRDGLRAYFGLLRAQVTRNTDDLESFHFARVSDPLTTSDGEEIGSNGGGPFLMLDPNLLRSSWGGQALAPSRTRGRVGYSVKLVSLSSLRPQGLAIDPDTESVLDFIQH